VTADARYHRRSDWEDAVGRRNLLALAIVAMVAMAACGDDDGDTAGGGESGGGALATVQTAPPLEPVVSELVTTYNDTSDGDVELAVAPQDQAVEAVSQGIPAILPSAWLEGVDADGLVIGRILESDAATEVFSEHGYLP